MSILGISDKSFSIPDHQSGTCGTMKGLNRDFIVTVVTDFADLILEIIEFVKSLFGQATTWETTEVDSLLVTTEAALPSAPPPVVEAKIDKRKDQVEATFSKIIGFMGGKVTYTREKGGFDQVSFPHSGTGTLNGIPFWKLTESWLNGSTLSIPKNLQVQVNYTTGEIKPSGRGITAKTARGGIYNLISIGVQSNGCVVFQYVTPDENKEFGDVTIKKLVVSEERVEEIFSQVTWEPSVEEADEIDETAAVEFDKPPPEVVTPVAAKTSPDVEADSPKPSLFNRVTTFASENSQAILGTVSTVALVGAYYLGYI